MNVRLENVQHLEENIGCKFLDIGLNNDFLDMTPKSKTNKRKNKQTIVHQTKKFLHSKGNHRQNGKSNLLNCRKYL